MPGMSPRARSWRWPGLPSLQAGRSRDRLSHLRLRRVQRLPARLHDLLHQQKYRRAYGWQRDGGMAEYMVAEEKDLIALPDELSYADGAQVACGFGTVYEGLEKIGINGNHAVLITGLGPVGLAAGALCRKLGAEKIIGIDFVPERMRSRWISASATRFFLPGPIMLPSEATYRRYGRGARR